MNEGLKDFIQELRDYGNARKGDLAGMILEAANRLEAMSHQMGVLIDTYDRWITDRDPTPEECEAVDATGFILCISGKLGACTYDHAIDMQDNFFEDGRWYLHGVQPNKTSGLQGDEHEVYKVHGWMLPPVWNVEEG